ncbi:SDR family oxidoreductase [Nakamurella endophytica]|uniref:3-oxoacyl-ACP reductase n=1 Tax=Nakamurella endophytica TaxID=1748367 RepID=A0A917WGD1_9ACTN|nr:SDR family NAD(P)-dependent oxidoreductase [Nakamurella endophytica]GGM02982.1 3-oxoacyl-ACP reductase [Nakamurella endophytica]
MPAEKRDLTGSVVLVTGAGAGIGGAVADLLVEAGACVVACDVDAERARQRLAALPADQVLVQRTDVRSPADLAAAVQGAVQRWGRLDSVVANAGVGVFGSILDYPDETLQRIVDTNLLGTVWAVRAAVREFDRGGAGGDVVVLASVAGLGTAGGNETVYAASKFGQVGFAISLDREVRHRGIRVSTIAPAAVDTGFADGVGRVSGDPVKQSYLRPADVAAAVVTVLEQPRRMRTALWSMWSMSEDS